MSSVLSRARVRWLSVGVLSAVAATAAAYLLWWRVEAIVDDAPPDPRLTIATPFRNVHPDVAYVGDAACVACHQEIDASYHHHAMGRSAEQPARGQELVRFKAFNHVDYRSERVGDQIFHVETINGSDGKPIAETRGAVVAVIGSGSRGKSYLCERAGSIWQSGISWFAEKPGWDVSPQFVPGQHVRRSVAAQCLFCHVNRIEPIAGSFNRFQEPAFGGQLAIGCERCHGPGALHVAERSGSNQILGKIDHSIVNPKHLSPELRDDVCRQCHLQGEQRLVRRGRGSFDYRPGLPLDQFIGIYVTNPALTDFHKSVGQVEQTAISRCSAGSQGRFGCTSCHDPHRSPAPVEREDYYRTKCMTCHQGKGCNVPLPERQARHNSCIACHMPRSSSSNIVHTAVTDHRILRMPQPAEAPKSALPPGELPLAPFGKPARWPDDSEQVRDLAVTLSLMPKLPTVFQRDVAERLQSFTEQHRGDAAALEALARIRLLQGDATAALRAAESALKAQPQREQALVWAAEAALQAGKPERARQYAERAVAISPGDPEHRLRLAQALLDDGRYVDAEAELGKLLAVTPNHPQARATLAVCIYKQGNSRAALAELERAAAINPRDATELRNWFSGRTR